MRAGAAHGGLKGIVHHGLKPQVMVVDDDLAMCGFLRTFLDARLHALTVTSADEAVRRFPRRAPGAVLLDVVMPGQHGRPGRAGGASRRSTATSRSS